LIVWFLEVFLFDWRLGWHRKMRAGVKIEGGRRDAVFLVESQGSGGEKAACFLPKWSSLEMVFKDK
jgi:hypothetical protein